MLSRFRLAAVAVALGIGLVGALFYAFITNHYIGEILGRALGPYTDTLVEVGLSDPDPDIWRRIAERHRVAILVEPAEGDAQAFDSTGEPSTAAALEGGQIRAVRIQKDGSRVSMIWTLSSFPNTHVPLLGGLVLMVVAVVGSAYWFLHHQLKPLEGLHDAVEGLSRGELSRRAPVVRDDEIGRVAGAFNVMASRVTEMLDDRERLLADVSHELRSPVARMKVAVELLESETRRDALARDLKEMESLISTLLERQKLRSTNLGSERDEVDLAEVAGETIATFANRSPAVLFRGNPIGTIQADRTLLRLLLQNLIDNAIKFSSADSQPVEVSLEDGATQVLLRVVDDGVGLAPGSEERVFEPFVKLDPARGHGVGYGLGLDLCRRIVALHGGSIRLVPMRPRGTEAVVTLPRQPGTPEASEA